MTKDEVLETLSFYSQADETLQNLMRSGATYKAREKGTILFVEGGECETIGFVGKGNIRVSKTGTTGREITLYHVGPGEGCVLNLSCAFAQQNYLATAVVEDDTEMILFPVSMFQQWLNTESVRNFVFQLFSLRFAHVITLIEEIIFRKMDHRLAQFLTEKFENKGKPRRSISYTQEQIASELGTAREVINRLLKEFERIGAISSSRGIIRLTDEQILKDFQT